MRPAQLCWWGGGRLIRDRSPALSGELVSCADFRDTSGAIYAGSRG